MKNKNISKIVKISIFSALSTVLYFIRFPLPPFPPFLEIQFSNLPAIIGGFAIGPVSGLLIVLIRTIITLPFSVTQYVGELADLLIGGSVVLIASLVYRKIRTRKGGAIALGLGMLTWVIVAAIANRFILLPYFMKVGNITSNDFIELLKIIPWASIFKTINNENYMLVYIVCCVVPFNLIISLAVSLITFLVYKKTSNVLKRIDHDEDNSVEN